MTTNTTTRALFVALFAAILALIATADSRYAIADSGQPKAMAQPTMVDPIPTPVGENAIAEPAQPVTPEPTDDDLSAIGYRLSAMENTVYLPLVQRSEKYPPANRAYELEVLRLVNEQRATAGLWPLVEDTALTLAARRHAMDMAVNNLLSHTGTDGSTYAQRMVEEGFAGTPWTEAAVMARLTPAEAVNAWMDSPPHRAIVLDSMPNHIGIGIYPITSGVYAGTYSWVIDLGVLP